MSRATLSAQQKRSAGLTPRRCDRFSCLHSQPSLVFFPLISLCLSLSIPFISLLPLSPIPHFIFLFLYPTLPALHPIFSPSPLSFSTSFSLTALSLPSTSPFPFFLSSSDGASSCAMGRGGYQEVWDIFKIKTLLDFEN